VGWIPIGRFVSTDEICRTGGRMEPLAVAGNSNLLSSLLRHLTRLLRLEAAATM
jgi:hypothetical protein